MRLMKIRHRVWLSIVLSLSLGTFSLSSFAASEVVDSIDEGIPDSILVSQAPTGTLTAKGPVLVNSNEAKTGATVPDGSVIQTRTGGHAVIELGAPGRVELDPITGIILNSTPTSIETTMLKCGQGVTLFLPAGVSGLVKIRNMSDVGVLEKDREVDVKVHKGEALVKYGQGKEKIVKAGDHEECAEDDLTLEQLDHAGDHEHHCDEPQHESHELLLLLRSVGLGGRWSPTPRA